MVSVGLQGGYKAGRHWLGGEGNRAADTMALQRSALLALAA